MSARDADAYLATLSADKRATLEKVRQAIRAAAPEAEEGLSYGMPAFILGKPIAGYSASANHCSYFPMSGQVIAKLAEELNGYEISKGGFRFPIGKPPPATLIRKLVKARLAEIDGAAAAKKAPTRRAAAKKATVAPPEVGAILAELKRGASPAYKADMAKRYGIVTKAAVYGAPVATLRALAKKIGYDHALAEKLWASGVHDARMLATMVDDPALVTPAQMNRWVKDCDNWALVDTACFHYWDRTPHAFKQIEKWSKAKDEFVKRAAFALLASCALHGQGSDADHLRGLQLIEREASDLRNFVKKAVNWALRAIGGKKSPKLRTAARALAQKLAASEDATARWNGKDALRAFGKGA
ncbi:MAG TPA: DNA alkylation repair protein [Vitreimonas sp.]|uniref:DNA alkylation repair protein n=1 Tax=Vitreimonas sp. TaxID=3069702 RepID=UPI002D6C5960|nr:DNA alkylation repair protein [Vitreimonas sp.]HYD86457.1 DNA alkylation repair protein [Vitreimonas sp.]